MDHSSEIQGVLDAIQVDSAMGFYWFGTPHLQPATLSGSALSPEEKLGLLSLSIQDHLYSHFFCTGQAVPHAGDWGPAASPLSDVGSFGARLSEANHGEGSWDEGWEVDELSGTSVGLIKQGLKVMASADEYLVRHELKIAPGEKVSLRHPKGSHNRSPGFYLAYGDRTLDSANAPLVRIYWNITSAGAPHLVHEMTSRLNRRGVAFQLKVLGNPRSYVRHDSAVLYLATDTYAEFVTRDAPLILGAVNEHLIDGVPALTKPIARGISVAEDPQGEGSFGTHRCGAIAEALVASVGLELSTTERLGLVHDQFTRSGINPELPFLSLGSGDAYPMIDLGLKGESHASKRSDRVKTVMSQEQHLQVASDIGSMIVETAFWHRSQCNWLGALGPAPGTSQKMRFGSLGSTLYDGTAGIALFLGELFGVTDDKGLKATALGAIRHALAVQDEHGSPPLELYTGTLGTGVVAARLGQILGREELTDHARSMTELNPPDDIGFDLIAGAAGSLVGFLNLYRMVGERRFLARATEMGRRLVSTAQPSGSGVSWHADRLPGRMDLTGLSHGAAGAAYALLELYAETGEATLVATAEAAMRYERAWFSRGEQNWPDFREVTVDSNPDATRFPYSTTWCHGAPGIAISRIRAAELLSDPVYADEAKVALHTTRDHLQAWIRSGRANYSLCHGAAGNADVLLAGARSSARLEVASRDLIEEIAGYGRHRYRSGREPWPCGIGGGGVSPGLMTGLAGIGHFYLRMAQPTIPSVLSPAWSQDRVTAPAVPSGRAPVD